LKYIVSCLRLVILDTRIVYLYCLCTVTVIVSNADRVLIVTSKTPCVESTYFTMMLVHDAGCRFPCYLACDGETPAMYCVS
jgi:hypothetical protein